MARKTTGDSAVCSGTTALCIPVSEPGLFPVCVLSGLPQLAPSPSFHSILRGHLRGGEVQKALACSCSSWVHSAQQVGELTDC